MTCSRQRCRAAARYLGLCRKHALKRADDAFSLWVRRRDGRCENCGTEADGQCAHVISRGARYIRFDPRNATTLCSRCHQAFTLSPGRWAAWVEERFPGLLSLLGQAEAEGQRSGHSVDLEAVIRRFESKAA